MSTLNDDKRKNYQRSFLISLILLMGYYPYRILFCVSLFYCLYMVYSAMENKKYWGDKYPPGFLGLLFVLLFNAFIVVILIVEHFSGD